MVENLVTPQTDANVWAEACQRSPCLQIVVSDGLFISNKAKVLTSGWTFDPQIELIGKGGSKTSL